MPRLSFLFFAVFVFCGYGVMGLCGSVMGFYGYGVLRLWGFTVMGFYGYEVIRL